MKQLIRCGWSTNDPLYIKYHDEEWGVPLHDDQKHFEVLILEGAQAGLSWLTVLRKRENYRKAFDHFDAVKIAQYDEHKVQELLQNEGIIRNRLKVRSTITNAQAFLRVKEEFGTFDAYIWQFVGEKPLMHSYTTLSELPSRTIESDTMSRDLLKRGFKFVGSTICYAYMQATGMVNDHITSCFRHDDVLIL